MYTYTFLHLFRRQMKTTTTIIINGTVMPTAMPMLDPEIEDCYL